MIGNHKVGNSALIVRYVDDTFKETPGTIGVDFKIKTIDFEEKTVKL